MVMDRISGTLQGNLERNLYLSFGFQDDISCLCCFVQFPKILFFCGQPTHQARAMNVIDSFYLHLKMFYRNCF